MKTTDNTKPISITTTFAWIGAYLLFCGVFPEIFSRLWEHYSTLSGWLDLFCDIVFNSIFFVVLLSTQKIHVSFFSKRTGVGVLLAIGCAALFYLLLDLWLDPFFDKLFPESLLMYQNNVQTLFEAIPIINFISICLFSPIVEELFIRGCVLGALREKYGVFLALIISTLFFGILHFNFLQTISAIFCGIILGGLYIWTNSLFCTILAHSLYNIISYVIIMLTYTKP